MEVQDPPVEADTPVSVGGDEQDEEGAEESPSDVAETSTLPEPTESEAKLALRGFFGQMEEAASQPHGLAPAPRAFCLQLGIPPMVQQDSQEFWKLLLPALEDERITDLYKGSFEDYITALDGSGRERRREELFLDLSLDIGERYVDSLFSTENSGESVGR